MKKMIAAGLSALLLCGLCPAALAADTTAAAQTDAAEDETGPVQLRFDTLEQTVRENNVSIKSYDLTVKSAEMTDVEDSYTDQYISLENQIYAYRQQIADLNAAISALSGGEGDDALRTSLTRQRDIAQSSLNSLLRQYDDLDDDEDDAKDKQIKTVTGTRREMQNAADLICVSAENTYISLQTMQYSFDQNTRSLAQLDRTIAVTEKQVALGMTGVNTLKSLQSQRQSLVAQQVALQTQCDNLLNTLALQCGYTTGTELSLDTLPDVTQEQLDAMQYEADLAEAMKNSYSIWSKEHAMELASDDYENGTTNTLHAFEAAKVERDAEKESVTASFRQLYKDVQEKQADLAAAEADLSQAQKTFAVEQVRYDLGLISLVSYADAQDTLATAEETASAAHIDLLTAYNTYQWAKRGVMTSSTAA